MTRRKKLGDEVPVLQIIEEAFHLLRSAPGITLWLYFLGTVPFVCLMFYFWADMSRSSYASRDSGLVALGLASAFFWKCSWQARFCRNLWNAISPGYVPRPRGWQRFRYHAALWVFQAFSLPLVLLAACFVLPIAWVVTFYQNGYALSLTHDYGRAPLRQLVSQSLRNSHFQWAQNHGIWVTLTFIGILAWVNIYAACTLPPMAAKTFLGMETIFSMNPSTLMNSTFVFGTLLITYLVLSPLVKAIFVLRCFYAESRTTGADLLSRLTEIRENRKKTVAGLAAKQPSVSSKVAALVILSIGFAAMQAGAEETGGARVASMESAIQDTMAAKKYQWKFSRNIQVDPAEKELNWFQIQMSRLADSVEARFRVFKAWLSDKIEALLDKFFSKNRNSKRAPAAPKISDGAAAFLMNVGWGILIVVVAGLIGWLLFVLAKYYREADTEEVEEDADVGEIDLESEDIVADQLHEDQWMKLAQDQIRKGEDRLAIRALFLATLANLGERGLLKIQKYKSNRDYGNELDLKAREENILREAFRENTGLFERAWYGLHQIGEESVDHFMKNYKTITAETP
ncbi:MAG: DUF4129 domain-containing protein [Verrucomicrobiales bacterium]|nr:DUF4129 domain-containing protein [Verrucomicrobiales bacterium]